MIKMQMRIDDDRDVVRRVSGPFKKSLGKRLLAKDAVHLKRFLAPFFADARLDQNSFNAGIDKDTVHIQTDAIELVGSRNTFPKNTRDDSENRPAVQSEF